MTNFEHSLISATLPEGLEARRRALLPIAWIIACGSLLVILLGSIARDYEPLVLIGFGILVVANFIIALVVPWLPTRLFYPAALYWGVGLCAVSVVQMGNFFLGPARELIEAGYAPIMLSLLPLPVIGMYTLLSYASATRVAVAYNVALISVLVLYLSDAREDASSYAVIATVIMVFIALPATTLLMRLFYRLHASAVATVQDSFHMARAAAAAEHEARVRDPVTGVFNRIGIFEELEHSLQEADGIAVIRLNLREPDKLHKQLGDREFERLLKHVAIELGDEFGEGTQLGRIEGCEYVAWSVEPFSEKKLNAITPDLLSRLWESLRVHGSGARPIIGGGIFPAHSAVEFVLEETGFRLYMNSMADDDSVKVRGGRDDSR